MKLWNFWRPAAKNENPHPNIPESASKLSCPFKSNQDANSVDESTPLNTEKELEDKKKS